MTGAISPKPTYTVLDFDALRGWRSDDHAAALDVFCQTCSAISGPNWAEICATAAKTTDPCAFFETHFRPVLIQDGTPMLFTGYFEPELRGSLTPDVTYRYPVYALPPNLPTAQPWLTRREIEESGALAGQGLEIAWLADRADAFFMQVQGSGRIRLQDGHTLRLGYAGKNGHVYASIGAALVAWGIYPADQISAEVIHNWIRLNPEQEQTLLWTNPSYVFFRKIPDLPADQGPVGAMNQSVTALRSIAVDPAFVPLGAPVWIEKSGDPPMNRLMVVQDTGSAIKGAQRADIFFGTGADVGRLAGGVRDSGRMVVLLPVSQTRALANA